ncbi:unnamed protein product [Effrenium voratum]|uniref:Uncharacterized protein n=1 Tax=Effrenium voratum TaxID=2562239 RepID=A0AA36IET8_9DINO|nr:unnamed protein product [Effrenium voratum]
MEEQQNARLRKALAALRTRLFGWKQTRRRLSERRSEDAGAGVPVAMQSVQPALSSRSSQGSDALQERRLSQASHSASEWLELGHSMSLPACADEAACPLKAEPSLPVEERTVPREEQLEAEHRPKRRPSQDMDFRDAKFPEEATPSTASFEKDSIAGSQQASSPEGPDGREAHLEVREEGLGRAGR